MLVGAFGCGDDHGSQPADAAVDAPPPCNYTEVSDATNDVTAETTGFTLGGAAQAICGNFDPSHFNATLHSADDDRYRVTTSGTSPLVVDLTLADPSMLTGATIRFWSVDAQPQLVGIATYDPTLSDHGAFIITLPAASYDVVVSADAAAALQGPPVGYRLQFAPMPACDETADPPAYSEANDAGGANDTVAVDFSKDPSFTLIPSTAPEVTALEVAPGQSSAIAGMLDTTAHTDQYLDRDTYEVTTSDSTNELAVRVTWPSTTSDVDYVIFEAATMKPVVASNLSSDTGPELAMFGVKPSTKYWLWVGDFTGSTATSYRATVCGNHY